MTIPVRIEADYLIETPIDPRSAAETMAGEQSSGTFVAVPGETPELKQRAAARLEKIELLDAVSAPSLPVARPINSGGPWQRARVTLSWPLDNIGASLPNLVTAVAGNLWELRQLTGLRLLDLRLPLAFASDLCWTEVRRLRNPRTRRRQRSPADRHHHQAECRPQSNRDGKSRGHALRRRDRFHQGR